MTRGERNYSVNRMPPDLAYEVHEEGHVSHVRVIPKVPPLGKQIWRTFWSLSRLRVERSRISPETVLSWHRMHGLRLATIESKVLEFMDMQFLKTLNEEISFNEERRVTK